MAQDVAPAPAAAEEEMAVDSGEIVVTARRREERLQDVPVSVTAFSSEALQRSNISTAADLTSITPGFTFAPEGGKDNIAVTLRGIGNLPIGSGKIGRAHSELQSLIRLSYAVFCLTKKNTKQEQQNYDITTVYCSIQQINTPNYT